MRGRRRLVEGGLQRPEQRPVVRVLLRPALAIRIPGVWKPGFWEQGFF